MSRAGVPSAAGARPRRGRRRIWAATALAAAAVAGALLWTRTRPAAAEGASVLLVTLDTLRADHVGAYGASGASTPALDALARRGVTFDQALAAVPLTLPSHATILSGLDPLHHGVRDNGTYVFPKQPATLATLLAERGYATGAFVGAYVLDRRFGLARGFQTYDDRIDRRPEGASVLESERSCDVVVEAASRWIERQSAPFLAWAHFYDPHAPYAPPERLRERFEGRPYDAEIAFADECLGRLVAAAEARAGPRLLVAVVADHGEGLGDHGERTHGLFVYQSTLRVPLILAGPGVARGQRRAGIARTADVLPTLLGRLRVPAPAHIDGADLLSGPVPDEAYAETFYPKALGWAPLRSYRIGALKLIDAPKPELFDLAQDPAEARNLFSARPVEAERMRNALAALRRSEAATGAAAPDPEVAERLRSLGYVGSAAPPSAEEGLTDPKDALELWHLFEQANDAEARGDREDAIACLRRILEREPANAAFRRSLVAALRRAGRGAEAAAALADLTRLAPDDALAWHEQAITLADAGRFDEALRSEEKAVALNPQLPEPLNHLGILEARRNRPQQALRAFEAATALDPNNARAWSNRANALRGLGRNADAAEAYRTAARLAPRDTDPLNGLGVLAAEAGRFAEAEEQFRQVLEREPRHQEAQLNLAYVQARQGRKAEAEARLKPLVAREDTEPSVRGRARALLASLASNN